MRSFALVIAALTIWIGHAHAQTYYFCDQLNAYYPAVARCPFPWRTIISRPQFPSPDQTVGPPAGPLNNDSRPEHVNAPPRLQFVTLGDGLDDLCSKAVFPSTIALCSDKDLRSLAMQRQSIFDDAKQKLQPDAYKAMVNDQSGWVKTYPLACGLVDVPSLPLSPDLKRCLTAAGRARVAYLRTYSGGDTDTPTVTPTTSPERPASTATTISPANSSQNEVPATLNAPTASVDSSSQDSFEDEVSFIAIVSESMKAYNAASNDMAKGGVRAARKEKLCKLLPKLTNVTNWQGTIQELSSNSDGKGVVSVKIANSIYVKTWNNSFSDISSHTLINPSSSVFRKLSSKAKGDDILFSGSFIESGPDCIEEGSLTQSGSVTEPEFIFKFSDVH